MVVSSRKRTMSTSASGMASRIARTAGWLLTSGSKYIARAHGSTGSVVSRRVSALWGRVASSVTKHSFVLAAQRGHRIGAIGESTGLGSGCALLLGHRFELDDPVLQFEDAVVERFRRWRATRHVDV